MTEPIRVLHVDDDRAFGDLVATFLEREGTAFDVATAESADEGLSFLEANEVDCVVSDYQMPGRNGIEFLAAIREMYPDLPFVLYTGKGSEEVASEAISAGATDYLQKGTDPSQYAVLAHRVRNAVDRYRSQRRSERAEELLERITEVSGEVLYMVEGDWSELLVVSAAYEEVFGEPVERLEGDPTSFLERVHPEDRERVRRSMERVAGGEPDELEFRVERTDGDQRRVHAESKPIFDDDGDVDRIVGYVRDVTEQVALERDREKVMTRVNEAIVEVDDEWRFTRVNDRAEELYGMSAEELVGWDFWTVFSSALDTRFEEEYRRVMAEREPAAFVEYYEGLDGWFDVRAYPQADGGVAFYFVEVTEDLERDRELEWQATRYEAYSGAFPDLAFIVSAEGRFLDFCGGETSRELLVADPEDFLGSRAPEVLPDQVGEDLLEVVEAAIEEGEPGRLEYALEVAGAERDFEALVEPLSFPVEGEPAAVVVARDVTEDRVRERELARQGSLLSAQQAAVLDGMLVVDEHGDIVSYNDRFLELWDLPESVAEAGDDRAALEYVTDSLAEPEQFLASVDRLYDNPEETARDEVHLADGRVFDRYTTPLVGEDGTYYGRLWTFRDVTERIRREAELERTNERLEEFASIVSHDLRNPLNVAKGRLDLARGDGTDGNLEAIGRALERMEALIDDLLTLAREGWAPAERTIVDLDAAAERSWEAVRTGSASLASSADARVRADESKLSQLFENLFRNAVEHGGPDVSVRVGALADGFFVEDDGPGIPPDAREEVFEPGYSSREGGTGFGLSIVRQVAEAHGWSVRAVEGESGGARFEVTGVELEG